MGMTGPVAQLWREAVAQGKPTPPEVLAALPKMTPQNITQQASALTTLINAGVTGDKLATGIAQFIAGGAPAIKDLLPKDTPVQIQQQYQASMLKHRAGKR